MQDMLRMSTLFSNVFGQKQNDLFVVYALKECAKRIKKLCSMTSLRLSPPPQTSQVPCLSLVRG